MDARDLVPVKIEYSNSLPMQQFTSTPPSFTPNVVLTGLKRKRGRPRRNEFLGNVEELAVEVSVVDANDVDRLPIISPNETVARDNSEDKDREVLNNDGVAVDLAALGSVEHPYWDEIRSRTEGLRTEEELLGFLEGLNGKWASMRRKKRIVDAGEFGSKLPVGWKLLLSVKKKNGHVWVHCRRYISPSGLHFVSCKGVSSYLLSLHGVHDTNPYRSAEYDIVNDGDKLISVPVALQDTDGIENLVSCAPSPHLDSATGNLEVHVVNAGRLLEDRIGESLCCNECNVTFNDKDESLQHQSSFHQKNGNKFDVPITDGVIIKDGQYECQFCRKTFSERHQYNGHVCTHVRSLTKTAGEASPSVHPSSSNKFPIQDIAMEGSSHNAVEVCNSISNYGTNICSLININDERFGDLVEASGNMKGAAKATDMVSEINPCSAAEVLVSSNENKSFCEDAYPNDSAAEIRDRSFNMQGRLESYLSGNDAADSVQNGSLIEKSAALEEPNQIMMSKSCLFDCNDHVEECLLVNNTLHNNDDSSNQTRNELKLDSQKLAVNDSVFDILGIEGDQENLGVSIKEKSQLDYVPCEDIATTESISTSGAEASKLDKDPTFSLRLLANDEKACREDNVPNSTLEWRFDETASFGKCENESSKADNSGEHEELQFGIASAIQSWNRPENASKKRDSEVFSHLFGTPGVQDTSKSQLVADDASIYCYENNDGGVHRRDTTVPEFDCLQNFGNGQSSDLFNSSCARLSSNATGTEQDTRLGVCSVEDNMITLFNDTMEERRQDLSEGILLDRSGVSRLPDEAYDSNKIYSIPANSEVKGFENAGKHELSLSFGSLHADMCAESNNRVEQESYLANNFNIGSGHKAYGDPTHSSILNSNIAANLEQDRLFGYPNLSFNDRTHEPDSFDVGHPGRDWDGRQNKIKASSHNFMIGFGNNSLQTNECVSANGSWGTGQDNVYGGCFEANTGPHIPSSSYFPTFGLGSNKDQQSSVGLNDNYGIQSGMMRPGRTRPVEYSFMGDQRVNTLPGEPKVFPFGTDMEQGMDSSFWLGKDALMTNASQASQATSVCVWCRNIFFHDPIQGGMQTGAIGTICPTCSSNIPGQFNAL